MTQHVLLTGATGYIGRHVLVRLLKEGFQVSIILRRKKGLLEGRLAHVFDAFPELVRLKLDSQLTVYEGDLSRPDCGLSDEAISKLKGNIQVFLNCAGMTCFDQEKEPAIRIQNVDGVRHAFELSQKLAVPHFQHVSTAFIAGNHPLPFSADDLSCGQTFKNPYEKSKLDAEVYLRGKFSDPRSLVSVYRPSIVVGGNVIGESQTMTTIYAFLKSLHFIRECCLDDSRKSKKLERQYGMSIQGSRYFIPMRFAANPETRLNLVSIFYLTDMILSKIKNLPAASGVYDVLSSSEVTIREVKETFCRVLGIEGLKLVPKDAWKEKARTPLEERFFRATRVYEPYLYSAPVFNLVQGDGSVTLEIIAREFLEQLEKYTERKASPRLNTLALSSLNVEEPERYLDRFSEEDFGDSFLKRIQFVNATVLFRVTGENPTEKFLGFNKGRVQNLVRQNGVDPDFGYEMNETTFQMIVRGALDPREALFQGNLKLLGDQAMCLKLGYIFSEHFRNINDRILEELVEI